LWNPLMNRGLTWRNGIAQRLSAALTPAMNDEAE
jgi:hypothetical protein